MNRDGGLDRLASEPDWDIVVIGGGATGLGAALDAASRGYRTALIERSDFASGTSSRSTKLVHGGVRYLKQGDIPLVTGALRERGLLFQNAPHLVHPLPFIIPSYHWWESPYFATGLKLYDWLAGDLGIRKTRILDRDAALEQIPLLNQDGFRGGVQYWDGQFDDARLATDLASNIWKHDGIALNYVAVKELIKENGRVSGLVYEDTITGKTSETRAKAIINATGVFSDSIRTQDNASSVPFIRASQGAHIVVSQDLIPMKSAFIVPKTTDGRVLFAIPWNNRAIIGTTDTPVDSISEHPRPFKEEIQFIVQNATNYLDIAIRPEDIKGAYAGLRPLVSLNPKAGSTAKLSRDHHIEISDTGLVTIAGGKWTTYRKMAEDVVDRTIAAHDLLEKPCMTESLPIETDFPDASGDTIHPDLPYTWNQVDHAIANEMPQTIEDVLGRRTRSSVLDARAASEVAPDVADRLVAATALSESAKADAIAAFQEANRLPEAL